MVDVLSTYDHEDADRLEALDLIAWVREPGAIHLTVAEDAGEVLRDGI